MCYLMETHFHTAETSPCGKIHAAEGIRLYAKHGYHAVVVTDHFQSGWFERRAEATWPERVDRWLDGYRKACLAGKQWGVQVILGMEFTFPGTRDDILVYGLTEARILANPDMHRLGPAGLSRLAKKERLLLVQAHPYRPYISQVYADLVHGLEVYNGNPRHQSDNAKAARQAAEHGWVALSGSDFHQEEDVARGGICLPDLPEDTVALAQMLRLHKTPALLGGLTL